MTTESSSGVLCFCTKHNALYTGHRVHIFKRVVKVDSREGFSTEKEEPAAVPYGLLKTTRKSSKVTLNQRGIDIELTSAPSGYGIGVSCLQLQQNPLEELPEGVGQLTNLDDIDLSNNQLTAVPDCLGNLNHLLKNLPSGINHNILYECLHRLDCTHNQFESIPPILPQMVSLDQLCLRQNKLLFLPELPSSRLKIRILMELHVGTHLIEVEAEHVKHLYTLSELELRDNKVKSVPEEITLVQGLECLDLINNDISSLPAALGLMLRLNILTLEGNPLRHIHGDLTVRMTSHYLLEDPDGNRDEQRSKCTPLKHVNYLMFCVCDPGPSDKQAVCVPEDLFNAVDSEPIASVSKNQLAAVLPRYSAYITNCCNDIVGCV
uniref:Leucine rich repeat containing 40 n=1 Tax=Oncorhynchus kisutch TaxID=8019 RepID=A0A8C7N6A7_ONCKI